jgi:hypothetical protein
MTTLSKEEKADIMYVHAFYDNALAAVEEYRRRFPVGTVSDRCVFSNVYRSISQTSAVPEIKCEKPRRPRSAKWRMTNWKWYSAALLLASEEFPVDSVLPKQHVWGTVHYFVLYPLASKMSAVCSQIITLHEKNFLTSSCACRSSARTFYSETKLPLTTIEKQTHEIRKSGLLRRKIFKQSQEHIHSPVSR